MPPDAFHQNDNTPRNLENGYCRWCEHHPRPCSHHVPMSGPLLLLGLIRITLMDAHVSDMVMYHHTSVVTISVSPDTGTHGVTPTILTMLSGMVLGVTVLAPAVPSTIPPGSVRTSLVQPPMILSSGCVETRYHKMKTRPLKLSRCMTPGASSLQEASWCLWSSNQSSLRVCQSSPGMTHHLSSCPGGTISYESPQ